MERKISDEELLYLSRSSNEDAYEALIKRLKIALDPLRKGILKRYGNYDSQEIEHLIVLGIHHSIEAYREDRDCHIEHFASVCAKREVLSYIRHETVKGLYHNPQVYSLDQPLSDNTNSYFSEFVINPHVEFDPKYVYRFQEAKRGLKEALESLDDDEKKIYQYWKEKKTYQEIANLLGFTKKQVDYRIQRVKKHIRSFVDYPEVL